VKHNSVVLQAKDPEDGWVRSDGSYSTGGATAYVGDSSTGPNTTYRTFLSFDLSTLHSTLTRVTSATLRAYQRPGANSPYTTLGTVRAYYLYYGTTLTGGDYSAGVITVPRSCTIPVKGCSSYVTFSSTSTQGLKSAVVTGFVSDAWANRVSQSSRAQFRLGFSTATDSDATSDYVLFDTGEGTTPPTLTVEYEYP
jgi:hypothetical protein